MLISTIDLLVKNVPYKKMSGFLKSQKINPDLIAISIFNNGKEYVPIEWKNFMPYGHKVVKIILCKMDNLFLYVGCSKDGETIIYNDGFSKQLLSKELNIEFKTESKIFYTKSYFNKSELTRLDILLDKIGHFGIDSLSKNEINELDYLSRQKS